MPHVGPAVRTAPLSKTYGSDVPPKSDAGSFSARSTHTSRQPIAMSVPRRKRFANSKGRVPIERRFMASASIAASSSTSRPLPVLCSPPPESPDLSCDRCLLLADDEVAAAAAEGEEKWPPDPSESWQPWQHRSVAGLLGADACSAQHVHVEQMTRPHHRQWWRRSVMPNARSQSPHTGASRSASQRSAAIGATRIDRTFVPGKGVEGGVW